MIEIQPQTKTLICIGTGGVGKTTLAASLAQGFARQGRKVLVLTIDPSQRLAQALGVKPDGEVYQVEKNLFACTLNHENAFKEFVLKAAAIHEKLDSKTTNSEGPRPEKLFDNKLYKQLSTKLSGSQDFSSLFKLNEFVKSKDYDLVILDTPPAQHTWNFLHAPEKIARLFNEGVAQWFRDPQQKGSGIFKKVLNAGTAQVFKTLELLTGSEFLKELSLFFQAVQSWQGPLEKQVWDCHKLLTSQTTEFILVTALDSSRISEALKLSHEITKQGYNLKSIIINRVPHFLEEKMNLPTGHLLNHLNYLKNLQLKVSGLKSKLNRHLHVYKSFELGEDESYDQSLQKAFDQLKKIE